MQTKTVRKAYTVSANDKVLLVVTDTAITITVPTGLPPSFTCQIIGTGNESSNNITIVTPSETKVVSNDNSINIVSKIGISETFTIAGNESTGGGGDTLWTQGSANATQLNSEQSIGFDTIKELSNSDSPFPIASAEFVVLADTTDGDIQLDLFADSKIFKYIKVIGGGRVLLVPDSGTINGETQIYIHDSCILVYDSTNWWTYSQNDTLKKVINVSSAQILTMGTIPIELLPQPPTNCYYEFEKIIFEYTHDTTAYTSAKWILQHSGGAQLIQNFYGNNGVQIVGNNFGTWIDTSVYWGGDLLSSSIDVINGGVGRELLLTTDDASDPTLGDGTLRVIIEYKIKTFGA